MSIAMKSPLVQFSDIDGSPLEAGFIYIGAANQNPETNPVSVYWDAAMTQPAAQPIRTTSGFPSRAGTPANIFISGAFSITIKNKRGTLIATLPNSVEWAAIFDPADYINPRNYGAIMDGVTDDTTADLSALTAAQNLGGAVVYYPGKIKTGGAVQRGGQRWIDQGFPTSFKRQQRWAYRADLVAANGEGTNAFQAISVNGTPIANTLNNFLATATPDVVTMSGWALRGAGGTNPLVVSNFGAWFENNTQIVWAQEIDVNNEGATMTEGDHKGGVGVAINTGSTYSPNSAIDIRRYTGAGSGPGFLQGIVIAGVRNVALRVEAMSPVTYPTLSPAAPGTIDVLQALVSNDTQLRFRIDQNGGMSWGSGAAVADVTLSRMGAGILQVGGAIQDTVAWATSNPTPVPASGAFTSASAVVRWNRIGKRVFFSAKVTITTNGTAAGNVQVTLPVAANATMAQIAAGRADSVSGKMLQGKISGSTLFIYNYDNTYPGATGETLVVTGIYEAA